MGKLGLYAPRDAADAFAFYREHFPVDQSYEQTPEEMGEFFEAYRINHLEKLLRVYKPSSYSSQQSPQQAATELARMMHAVFRWARFNMPVFNLSEGLTSKLVMTDPSKVQCDEVRFPYGTFCITIPYGFWKIDNFPVEAIWVHRFRSFSISHQSEKEMLFIGVVNSAGAMVYDNSAYGDPECLPGEASSEPLMSWIDKEKISPHFVSEEMGTDDWGLAQSVKRLIVNLMLYTAERDFSRPVKKPSRRYTKKGKQRATEMEPEIWALGQDIPVVREISEAGQAAGGTDRARWVLAKRLVVKGHWRRQWHGPGNTLRKLIWIEPYPKGGKGPRITHLLQEDPSAVPPMSGHLSISKKKRKRRKKKGRLPTFIKMKDPSDNPMFTQEDHIEQLEFEADEAADLAEAYYDQGDDDYGDYFADRSNELFDQLEQLTGEVYD